MTETLTNHRSMTDRVTGVTAVQSRFQLPGDIIQKGISNLPEEKKNIVRWFAEWCRQNDPGKKDLSTLLRKPNGKGHYSYDSIYHVFTGSGEKHGRNVDLVIEAMRVFKKVQEKKDAQIESGFIETRLSRLIFERLDKARNRGRIFFCFGDSQIGKTESEKEYTRQNNHGQTIYIEVPSGGTLGKFLYILASRLNITTKSNQGQLWDRIIESFDPRMLLIVDEAHRCLNANRSRTGSTVFDFLRELWNRKKCGLGIFMTNEGRDLLKNGPDSEQLKQIWRRRISPLQLPNVTPSDDLEKFAAAYGLEPATEKKITVSMEYFDENGETQIKRLSRSPLELQTLLNQEEGLGVWIVILQDASDIARDAKKPITWGAVIKAYCLSQAEAEMIK